MKILLTTVSLSSITGGGTAERTRRIARHLSAQGHHCALATMEGGDFARELRSVGMPVYVTPVMQLRFRVPLIRFDLLAKAVRSADAIHILGYWNLLSIATAFLACRYGKPYAFSAAGEFVGLDQPRPVARAFHMLLGRHMLRNASVLVAITPLERTQIMERFGFPRERVAVIPNGVELSLPRVSASSLLPERPFILFVGRLTEVKGPDLLVQAFESVASAHPEVTLVLAGPDFGMADGLQQLIVGRGLEGRVRFTGHLGESERTAAYQRAIFLVVPSRAEAMSLVALECGAAGTPVLLTDRCGFDEVEAIGGGRVVPATVEGLRDGLDAMLNQRTALAEAGEKLRAYVERNYAWPAIVKKLVSLLSNIVQDARGEAAIPSPQRSKE
jgi:glycosyltransferase involved in cell wall biosynthesis